MDELALLAKQVELQRLSYEVTLTQCVGSFLLLLITIVSVVCAYRAYKHQKLRAAKDAACSLAKFYADIIIREMEFISNVLEQSGYAEKIKHAFPYDKISAFDWKEAEEIINGGEDALKEISNNLYNIDPISIYTAKIISAKSIEERHSFAKEYVARKKDESTEETTYTIAHADLLQVEFGNAVVELLNNLEWFAMNFQYNLADEKVLYQSLHETFLSSVWSLYLHISTSNRPGADKYFTNIIWLFNLWKNRLRDIQKEAMKKELKYEQELNRLKDEQDAATKRYEDAKKQNKKGNLPTYTGKPL